MVTEILRPATVQEALKARALPGSAYLGGGTWLNAKRSMKPVTFISLEKLGLDAITADRNRCAVGATATFQQIIDHSELPDALRKAASMTASRTLRNMMTIGGEVALHPADSALVPALMALGAEVSIAGKKKPVPIRTLLSAGEAGLILSIAIPEPHGLSAVVALSRTSHSPRSLVIAARAVSILPTVRGLRLIAADCGAAPMRLEKMEASLEGKPLPARPQIEEVFGNEFSPAPDIHASARYKAYMTRVLVADVLLQMAAPGKGTP